MFVGFILLFMLFGMIDFCRAAFPPVRCLINLSREAANLAAAEREARRTRQYPTRLTP